MALGLTSCESGTGDAGKDRQGTDGELLSRSVRLFEDASSVRVTARAAVAMGSSVEISADRKANCRVDAQNEAFHVAVRSGGRTWMRWSDSLLERSSALGAEEQELYQGLHGKWLELDRDGRIRKSMVDLCALNPVRTIAEQLSAPGQRASRGPAVTENGERLIPLRQGEEGNSLTVFVKADGKPYPRKLVVDMPTFASEPVDFQLDAYGDHVSVEPPKAAETVRSARIEALAERHLAAGLPSR
ncbi:hypothetical protein [Streptomyces canarius]|uniref:hypothetical protein n=1 Tax=Streptomyces canarius TaxID=285453 RepID=UPI00167C28D2|nr:hypothetical protein [Streptomyces canarius]